MDSNQTELTHAYAALTPDCILHALESVGFAPDTALQAMNSYENRVYAFRDGEGDKQVVKFYRPKRWNLLQINEEHRFLFELADADVPVILPHVRDGVSCFDFQEFYFAVFPQRGGRAFEAGNQEQLAIMGRTAGRLHACAQTRPFSARPKLNVEQFVQPALNAATRSTMLPARWRDDYQLLSTELAELCDEWLQRLPEQSWQRCHGDLHPGNILWTGDGVLLVDFDDCRTAPAVQDLWMLADSIEDRALLIDEYERFCEFDWSQWRFAEVLRSMRLMQYTGWLAERWSDPTFPRHFPWFAHDNYFADHIQQLQEQLRLLQAQ